MKRYIFMISDGTGLTAESLGNSLLTQFEPIEFQKQTIPYVDSVEKAHQVVARLNECYENIGVKPLAFITMVNPQISEIINQAKACVFDLFRAFLAPLEEELNIKSSYTVGRTHGVANVRTYTQRINAINFTLAHDDGVKPEDYNAAEIILIGVSRSGKTPSCLYMALQFCVCAANYPITEDELMHMQLPEILKPHKNKLFGLTIDPARLSQIRSERFPGSQYATLVQCQREISEIETMYRKAHVPYLNSTCFSIEEIATKIMSMTKIKRAL